MFASGTNTWSTQITQLLTSPSPQLAIGNAGTNLLAMGAATQHAMRSCWKLL